MFSSLLTKLPFPTQASLKNLLKEVTYFEIYQTGHCNDNNYFVPFKNNKKILDVRNATKLKELEETLNY